MATAADVNAPPDRPETSFIAFAWHSCRPAAQIHLRKQA